MEKKTHKDVNVVTHLRVSFPVEEESDTLLSPLRKENPSVSLPSRPAVPSDASPMLSSLSKDTAQVLPEVAQSDKGELALSRLNDAARRIAAEEPQQQPGVRIPRASRLTPLYDISADIRRGCMPLPQSVYSTQPMSNSELDNKLPDLWPWLHDVTDEGEPDMWANHADPLQARRFPSSAEIKRIEEEDIRRAVAEGMLDAASSELEVGPKTISLLAHKRLRFLFALLVTLAIFALAFDTMLVSFTVLRLPQPHQSTNASPSLTLSKNVLHYGQTVTLYIRNFSPSSQVSLTRDVQELVLPSQHSILKVRADGSQNILITIDDTWKPGWHTLHAEDTTLHYTASATLRVDAGPVRPSRLLVSPATLDFGAGIVGANTLRRLTLQNEGGESISWTATSGQSWLSLAPNHGIFSNTIQIMVGVSRANLLPGEYSSTIALTANGDASYSVSVHMTVLSLPQNAGAVLAVSPAVLPFTAMDGMSNPAGQVLVVSNPGTQPLYWTLEDKVAATPVSDPSHKTSWLYTDVTSGVVKPQATRSVNLSIYSRDLLPGAYSRMLVFRVQGGHTALNSPETVGISFTVQPSCGLALSSGNLFFTAVAGGDPSTQALTLAVTDSCLGMTSWKATSSTDWLVITPANGELNGTSDAVMTVGVNTTGLHSGTYFGNISIAVGQRSTQSVAVQLVVQVPRSLAAPIIDASPLNLNVGLTLGQRDPPGQPVTISNTGGSVLNWSTSVNTLASSWLSVSPAGGIIAPGQTGQLQVNVRATNLSPGTYVGQIQIHGVDGGNVPAGGSPQTITVSFVVQSPCTLAPPSSKVLAFSATQGGANPASQSVLFTALGNCEWPLSWKAIAVDAAPSWLKFTAASGSFANGNQAETLEIAPNIAGLSPGTYSAQVAISALDAMGLVAQGSPQTFMVTLRVIQPCSLRVGSTSLSFTVEQGSTSPVQNIAVSSSGSCALPLSWSASANAAWLVLSATSGTDQGSGSSLGASINAAQLPVGSSTAAITLLATDKSGAAIMGSPITLSVNVTVTGIAPKPIICVGSCS